MQYILFDRNPEMVEAWLAFFANIDNVKVIVADIEDIKCDALVSPANSFGFMDGGIDYAISDRLGWGLQLRLQNEINKLREGELLVGKAMTIETQHKEIPYLISAPTMRVPMSFNINSSVNAYLAMKATLIEARQHENINTVAIPGFCTGCGNMDFSTAAREMYLAFKEIELEEKKMFLTFPEAQEYHLSINPKGKLWET